MMVDEIMEGFEDLKLDHPTAEGETRLGHALKTACLWRKELINLPNWTPPPPPPPPPASHDTPPPPPPPPPASQGTPPSPPPPPPASDDQGTRLAPSPARGGTPPPSPPAPTRPSSQPPPFLPRQQGRKRPAAAQLLQRIIVLLLRLVSKHERRQLQSLRLLWRVSKEKRQPLRLVWRRLAVQPEAGGDADSVLLSRL